MSKTAREWMKRNKSKLQQVEALMKECEDKDLPGLLAMVEVSEEVWAKIRLLIIAEVARDRGILDQTNKG